MYIVEFVLITSPTLYKVPAPEGKLEYTAFAGPVDKFVPVIVGKV